MLKYRFIKEDRWKDVQEKLKRLQHDIASATGFVREIEHGNLDVTIGVDMSDSDMKASLISMRDQMKKYSITEKQRNWVNEGMAKFVQILRSGNNEGRHQLSDNIIRNLVTYLKANQGALFALNDDDPNDVYLQMEACYAYDRKKYLDKRIELGEGLAGQVVLEKSTLYMTDLPKDFIKITSGLGEALPRNILLVPLKLEEKIYGVVELASFQLFQPYEIEFVEKLGESIASAVAAVKNGERTSALLKETQIQAEQLKAQEEEVRQNIEELSATQETMQRALKEVEYKEFYASQILNTSQDLIYTVDREYRLITWNKAFADEGARRGITLEKGADAFQWYPDYRKSLIPIWERALNGERFQIQWDGEATGKKEYYLSTYAPLRAQTGEIVEAVIYAKDITPVIEAQQKTERLLKEAQQQTEELKAQEEELRQNMEEMQSIQEELDRKNKEIEMARALERDRTDALAKSHKKNMLNLTSRFKELENQYKEKIALLEGSKSNGHRTFTKN